MPIFGEELEWDMAVSLAGGIVLMCVVIVSVAWSTLFKRRRMKNGVWKEYLEGEKYRSVP